MRYQLRIKRSWVVVLVLSVVASALVLSALPARADVIPTVSAECRYDATDPIVITYKLESTESQQVRVTQNWAIDGLPQQPFDTMLLDPGQVYRNEYGLPASQGGRTAQLFVRVTRSDGSTTDYASNVITLPVCSLTGNPLSVEIVCNSQGQPVYNLRVTNTYTSTAEMVVTYEVDGVTRDVGNFLREPGGTGEALNNPLPPEADPGDIVSFYVEFVPTDGSNRTSTVQRVVVPTCVAPTTTSTTLPPTSTTQPPAPDCDCDDRQVKVQKVGQIQERIEKNRTGITCYNVRMVDGGFVVSASGTEDALNRIFR
jgi:hypothetical protein